MNLVRASKLGNSGIFSKVSHGGNSTKTNDIVEPRYNRISPINNGDYRRLEKSC